MPEKAVDETPTVGGMNNFNAVTTQVHPLPVKNLSAGRSVAIEWETETGVSSEGAATP